MESICKVSRFFCRAVEEMRDAAPLRIPKRPCSAMMTDERGGIVLVKSGFV